MEFKKQKNKFYQPLPDPLRLIRHKFQTDVQLNFIKAVRQSVIPAEILNRPSEYDDFSISVKRRHIARGQAIPRAMRRFR